MKTMLALIALGGALCVAPAAAQNPAYDDRTQVVSTADLDLRSDRGRSVLDRRIRTAVQSACGVASSVDPEGRNEVRQCRADLMGKVAVQRDQLITRQSHTVLASKR